MSERQLMDVDDKTAKRYGDKLVGAKASCGIEIKSLSEHAIKRAIQRGISEDVALSLTVEAQIVYPGNTPGTICQQKGGFRMVINENTGNIISFIDLEEDV